MNVNGIVHQQLGRNMMFQLFSNLLTVMDSPPFFFFLFCSIQTMAMRTPHEHEGTHTGGEAYTTIEIIHLAG